MLDGSFVMTGTQNIDIYDQWNSRTFADDEMEGETFDIFGLVRVLFYLSYDYLFYDLGQWLL